MKTPVPDSFSTKVASLTLLTIDSGKSGFM